MERTRRNQVTVDGSQLSVDVYGEVGGPALLVVPGVLADAAAWAPVAERIEGWPAVAVVNRRGRSPSGPLTDRYGLDTEVRDAATVAESIGNVDTVFGWSYGGLIALHLADVIEVPHVIAYEPIMAPFGASALPDLERAYEARDFDETLEVVLSQISRVPREAVDTLRRQETVWQEMRRLAEPVYPETLAIQEALVPAAFAESAARVDLIIGEHNRGRAPYGTTFDDVAGRVPQARVHELEDQAHLAHLEEPGRLAVLASRLGAEHRRAMR